jgi:acetyl esterase/lipase
MQPRNAIPGSAALAALASRGLERLGFFAANAPAVFGAHKRQANAPYGPDPQHRLDVYTPLGSAHKLRPVIVFWHGGRWMFGDKADYRFVGAALAASGCVAVLPNYRHYPQVKMQGFMDDAARAALWAVAHACDFGGDVQRVYLMGHSAGAHMAALLTLDSSFFAAAGQRVPRIAGVIGLSGPYDFLPLVSAVDQDMFGPPANYPQSQPVNFVRRGAPPMLLVHGLEDETVRPKNSRNLAAALGACGVPVALRLYPGVSHAGTVAALAALARGRAPTLADIAAFLEDPGMA